MTTHGQLKLATKPCLFCNKSFLGYIKTRYCSMQCYKDHVRRVEYVIICKTCSKEFKSFRKFQIYCSTDCRDNRPFKVKVKICQHCGKEYKGSAQKFCSIKCTGLARKKVHTCEQCGSEFYKKKKAKGRFCGSECYNKFRPIKTYVKCEYCGKDFHKQRSLIARSQLHFCCPEHQRLYQKKQWLNHEFKKKKYTINPILRWKILERDGFRCAYCGDTPKDNARFHVDHITPRSLGGSDDKDNLITACEDCNVGKGASLVEVNHLGISLH